MSKLKKLPTFQSEAQERAFWEKHDSSDYVDWSKAETISLPNLKPSTKRYHYGYQKRYSIESKLKLTSVICRISL
jgi:hypothetical protein